MHKRSEARVTWLRRSSHQALFAVGGYCWLRSLRRGRLESAPTLTDWLATVFALRAIMPVLHCPLLFLDSDKLDEPKVSLRVGLPDYALPCFLALAALVLIVAAIRLHPRGYRLLPFGCAFLGHILGDVVLFAAILA